MLYMILLSLGLIALTLVTALLRGIFSGIDDSYKTWVKFGVEAVNTLITTLAVEDKEGSPVTETKKLLTLMARLVVQTMQTSQARLCIR